MLLHELVLKVPLFTSREVIIISFPFQMQQTNQRNHSWQAWCASAPLVMFYGRRTIWIENNRRPGLQGAERQRSKGVGVRRVTEVWRQTGSHTHVHTHTIAHTELDKSLTQGHDSTFTVAVRWLEARFGWSCAWQHRLFCPLCCFFPIFLPLC